MSEPGLFIWGTMLFGNCIRNRIEWKHDGLSVSSPCTNGDRVPVLRCYTLLRFACGVAIVWALLSSAAALAAMTLTESSLRSALVVDTKRPNTDKLTLRATFQLGPGEAADPAKETVALTIGPFSQTLPPGAFKQRVSANRTTWTFRGLQNGLKHVEITRSGQEWTIYARAKNINLSATANPITITI